MIGGTDDRKRDEIVVWWVARNRGRLLLEEWNRGGEGRNSFELRIQHRLADAGSLVRPTSSAGSQLRFDILGQQELED